MNYNPEEHEDNKGKSLLKIISKNTVPDLQVLHGLHGKKNYFTFNHTRLVIKKPIEVSSKQLDRFARLIESNARPLQPLNWRTPLGSF